MVKNIDPEFMDVKEFNKLRSYMMSLFDTENIKENFTIKKTTYDTAKRYNWRFEVTLKRKAYSYRDPRRNSKTDPYDKLKALQTVMNNILEMETKDYILTDIRTTKGFSITAVFRPEQIVAKEYLLNE